MSKLWIHELQNICSIIIEAKIQKAWYASTYTRVLSQSSSTRHDARSPEAARMNVAKLKSGDTKSVDIFPQRRHIGA